MQSKIVEILDEKHDGYWIRCIHGLNIFEVNDVSFEPDPRWVFLKSLAEDFFCAAHIGHEPLVCYTKDMKRYKQEIDSATLAIGNHAYEMIPVGLYGGDFWYSEEEQYLGYWVPHTSAEALDLNTSAYLRDHYLLYDSLALYVSSKEPVAPFDPHIPDPHLEGSEFQDFWINYALRSFDLMCITRVDGWYTHVYADDKSKFNMLQRAIDVAVDTVESSDWYQANKEKLHWDSEDALCLKL